MTNIGGWLRWVVLVGVLALPLGLLGSASARTSSESIEGTWNYGTGQILVTTTGAGVFQGVVTQVATFSAGCPHPVGETIWQLRGSGTHYEGTHYGFGTGGCTDRVTFPSVWDVTEESGQFTVKLCTTITTDNNRLDCSTLTRAKPPAVVVTPAAPSPVGLWRLNNRLYKWVAIKGGFEERAMTPHKLQHGCLVKKGDPVDRYYTSGTSGSLYKVAYRYWKTKSGGAGASGTNCTTHWEAPSASVKIVATATQMKMSCDNKTAKVCYVYKRVSS